MQDNSTLQLISSWLPIISSWLPLLLSIVATMISLISLRATIRQQRYTRRLQSLESRTNLLTTLSSTLMVSTETLLTLHNTQLALEHFIKDYLTPEQIEQLLPQPIDPDLRKQILAACTTFKEVQTKCTQLHTRRSKSRTEMLELYKQLLQTPQQADAIRIEEIKPRINDAYIRAQTLHKVSTELLTNFTSFEHEMRDHPVGRTIISKRLSTNSNQTPESEPYQDIPPNLAE